MPDSLMEVDCSPDCGFAVRSHDEREVINAVQTHSRTQHNQEMSASEARNLVKTVPATGGPIR